MIDKENIMDLNGAGDAFVGGFLAQYVQGRSVQKCIDAGLYLSGDIIKSSEGLVFVGSGIGHATD